jgi:hypothetical protein
VKNIEVDSSLPNGRFQSVVMKKIAYNNHVYRIITSDDDRQIMGAFFRRQGNACGVCITWTFPCSA